MLKSQEMRKLAPEMDPLRIGTGWKKEDLEKPQIMVESTYGDSHPGSGHLNLLVEEVRKGVAEAGGFGARYFFIQCENQSKVTHLTYFYDLPGAGKRSQKLSGYKEIT